MLTKFVPTDDSVAKSANDSFTISLGNSPFQHNVGFTITGFGYRQAENDGRVDKNAYVNPVFTTTVGDLFLSMCTKPRVTADNKILEPNGTFNQFVKKTISSMSGKTNGEILQAIVDGCKGEGIVVSRDSYVKLTKDGARIGAFTVELNFKA